MGQLGFGPEYQERPKFNPVPALKDKEISYIACGALHNAVIADGEVYTWGCNDDAANGRDTDEWYPNKVVGLDGKRIVQVTCGDCHTVALADSGEVFSWGTYKNNNGVIGYNKSIKTRSTAGLVEDFKRHRVVQISSGENHDLAITEHGKLYEWGDVRLGQRQSARVSRDKLVPRQLAFGKHRIRAAFATRYCNFAVTVDEDIYAWGLNNYGQCGVGDVRELLVPTQVPALKGWGKIKKIAGGIHHTLFLFEDGKVYSAGRGHYGRLGLGDEKDQLEPKLVESLQWGDDHVVDVGCGGENSMAVTEKGKLYTWGYGELFQLGNGEEKDEHLPFLVPATTYRALQVDGGAQHSIGLFTKK